MARQRMVLIDVDVDYPQSPRELITELRVGESVAFPKEKRLSVGQIGRVVGKKLGRRYTVKTTNDTECRIWRVE